MKRNSKLYPKGDYFAKGLDRMDEVPQKSPAAAGILAAASSRGRALYTERYRDAAIAFLLNGAFIWGMVEAFEHQNYAVGGILTFFELGWYSGNIYSAVPAPTSIIEIRRRNTWIIWKRKEDLSVGISFRDKYPVLAFRYVF